MFNLLAWLTGRSLRECEACGEFKLKGSMLCLSLGIYVCDAACEEADQTARAW